MLTHDVFDIERMNHLSKLLIKLFSFSLMTSVWKSCRTRVKGKQKRKKTCENEGKSNKNEGNRIIC